jgi:hypothetical protein
MAAAIHYTASNGRLWPISDMAEGHIHNALAKLERDHPHRTEEIAAMRAEIQAREARNDQAN